MIECIIWIIKWLYYFTFFPSSNKKLQLSPYGSKGSENEMEFPYILFIY